MTVPVPEPPRPASPPHLPSPAPTQRSEHSDQPAPTRGSERMGQSTLLLLVAIGLMARLPDGPSFPFEMLGLACVVLLVLPVVLGAQLARRGARPTLGPPPHGVRKALAIAVAIPGLAMLLTGFVVSITPLATEHPWLAVCMMLLGEAITLLALVITRPRAFGIGVLTVLLLAATTAFLLPEVRTADGAFLLAAMASMLGSATAAIVLGVELVRQRRAVARSSRH